MAAPVGTPSLRGTQSFVAQMGWVFQRPSLTLIELAWRAIFGLPFLVLCLFEAQQILLAVPLESAGLSSFNPQNPWVAVLQLNHAWAIYQPHLIALLQWLLPVGSLAWVIVSGLGRSLVLTQLEPRLPFRPVSVMVLQAVWLVALVSICWGYYRAVVWDAVTHISMGGEPDLVGYFMWAIFLSLGFYMLWGFISWPFTVAPLVMLLEGLTPGAALVTSFMLDKRFKSKLVEINMVMGIVRLALMVLAMVLSAAPLPFGDELGPQALHVVWGAAVVFYMCAGYYFQIVRLKAVVEFWKFFHGQPEGQGIFHSISHINYPSADK
jgi:hypothetical protein